MSLQKAYFRNLETGNQIFVQFNPTELVFSKSAQFADIAIPGLDAPVQQFVRGGTETVTVELYFDSTDRGMGMNATSVTDASVGDVSETYGGVDDFYELVKQNPQTHAPPKCLFAWGPRTKLETALDSGTVSALREGSSPPGKAVSDAPYYFTCIIESVERKFQLFSPEGVPIRARVTVKLREYQTVEQMVARLESADHTKVRVMKRRQRLEQLSAEEYNSPGEWRRIADENELDDPRRVPPGTILRLPPMESPSVLHRSR